MASISSLATWLSNSKGTVVIEWFGWQITTFPSFLVFSIILVFFFIYVSSSLIISLYNWPKKSFLKIKEKRINNALKALNEGVIASFYGNKKEVIRNLNIAKKIAK